MPSLEQRVVKIERRIAADDAEDAQLARNLTAKLEASEAESAAVRARCQQQEREDEIARAARAQKAAREAEATRAAREAATKTAIEQTARVAVARAIAEQRPIAQLSRGTAQDRARSVAAPTADDDSDPSSELTAKLRSVLTKANDLADADKRLAMFHELIGIQWNAHVQGAPGAGDLRPEVRGLVERIAANPDKDKRFAAMLRLWDALEEVGDNLKRAAARARRRKQRSQADARARKQRIDDSILAECLRDE